MNEGTGGSIVLAIIVVAIAFIMSYLAYNVNYTKAFRMKNKVISLYEKCGGHCYGQCKNDIIQYRKDIGYDPKAITNCRNIPFKPDNAELVDNSAGNGYCVFKVVEHKTENSQIVPEYQSSSRYYYRVITRINIVVPIVNNIFDLGALYVTGDTEMFYPQKESSIPSYCR